MGLFNRNQPNKNNTHSGAEDVETDSVIDSLLSEPAPSDMAGGVNLGYDEELDAGLEDFRRAQNNPTDAEQFAQAMDHTSHTEAAGGNTFDFADTPDPGAFNYDTGVQDPYQDAYQEPQDDAASYYVEDHRSPYTQSGNASPNQAAAPQAHPSTMGDYPETLPSITQGSMASPKRARLSHKPIGSHKSVGSHKPMSSHKPIGQSVATPRENAMPSPKRAGLPSSKRTLNRPQAPRYGVNDAIKLLRQLPETGDVTVLMTIVKKTLETAGIKVSDIITDAQEHRQKIHGKIQRLETEIRKLEKLMTARNREIKLLTEQLTETEQVQELLELAEMPAPTQFVMSDDTHPTESLSEAETDSQLVD
jgi:hypothetical protein